MVFSSFLVHSVLLCTPVLFYQCFIHSKFSQEHLHTCFHFISLCHHVTDGAASQHTCWTFVLRWVLLYGE